MKIGLLSKADSSVLHSCHKPPATGSTLNYSIVLRVGIPLHDGPLDSLHHDIVT